MEISLNGPIFVKAVGWIFPGHNEPIIADLETGEEPTLSKYLSVISGKFQDDDYDSLIKIDPDSLKRTGLQRARSASKANKFAAVLINELIVSKELGDRTGLFSISKSSVPSICRNFEKNGFEQGWELNDPFDLPNSIPTALATSLSRILSTSVITYSFCGGLSEWFSAIENATYLLNEEQIDDAIIICAEQVNEFQTMARSRLKGEFHPFEGASLMVLSKHIEPRKNTLYLNSIVKRQIDENTKIGRQIDIEEPELHSLSLILPLLILKEKAASETVDFMLNFSKFKKICYSLHMYYE